MLWPVSAYPIPNNAPDPIGCIVVAVEIIGKHRKLVYQEPRLKKGKGPERTATDSKCANNQFERRNEERRYYEILSQYYPLHGLGQKGWECPKLLLKGNHGQSLNTQTTFHLPKFSSVLHDLPRFSPLPESPNPLPA